MNTMTFTTSEYFQLTFHEPGVLVVLLDRPQKRNAITNQVLEALVTLFEEVEANDDVKCIVLTGGQKIFAAGADIHELSQQNCIDTWLNPRPKLWQALDQFSKPCIAAVNGYALGAGLELALLCDFIIAGQKSRFGLPEVTLGLIPGAGGTQRLTRYIGHSLANQMVLTGESILAEQALRTGLVSEVVEAESCIQRAIELATLLAKLAPLALKAAKQSLKQVPNTTLDQGLKMERQLFSILAASKDRQRGIDAFILKQTPNYQND